MTPAPQERAAAPSPPAGPPLAGAVAAVQPGPAPALTPRGTSEAGPGPDFSTPSGMAKIAAAMSEGELERKVRGIARELGLLAYHTHDSRRSPEGYPDWTFCGPRGVMWRELKRENGRLTTAQRQWLAALLDAGQDACVWRPSDLLAGRVARKLAALAGIGAP